MLLLTRTNLTVIALLLIPLFGGCIAAGNKKLPETSGEGFRGVNGYTPLDPLPVKIDVTSDDEQAKKKQILNLLPDTTMRLAVRQYEGKFKGEYGPVRVGVGGNSYTVILDYIQYTTKSFGAKKVQRKDNRVTLQRTDDSKEVQTLVPVYIGVGVRLIANVTVQEGTVDLTNLFAIGAAAQGKRLTGDLVIQSMGLYGEGVSAAIPIPTELNETTIQNALMAIGTVKAKIYDPTISCTPRALAVFNPMGDDPETINSFISTLLDSPIPLP